MCMRVGEEMNEMEECGREFEEEEEESEQLEGRDIVSRIRFGRGR